MCLLYGYVHALGKEAKYQKEVISLPLLLYEMHCGHTTSSSQGSEINTIESNDFMKKLRLREVKGFSQGTELIMERAS